MYFSAYSIQLLKTIIPQCLLVIIGLHPFILTNLDYPKSKKRSKAAKAARKRELRDFYAALLLACVALVIYTAIVVAPCIKDIAGEHYSCLHGEYQKKTSARAVIIADDGEEVHLDFSKGIDMDDFPENGTYGTAVYAENSKYLLEFIPDEAIDEK